mgnify:CR=1 FL=1|jgi:hypothetical protein
MAINMDLINKELAGLNNSSGDIDFKEIKFTPKVGKTKIRFVPNKFSEDMPFKRYKHHYNLKPMVTCLENQGEECPVCKYCIQMFREAKREDDESKRKLARDLMGSERFYAPILVRGEDKIRVFAFSKTVYEKILGFVNELGDITDPDAAPDFIVEKTPPGANGLIYGKIDITYDIKTLKNPLPIASSKEEIASIIDSCPDINTIYNKPTSKEDAIETMKKFISQDEVSDEQKDENNVATLLEEATPASSPAPAETSEKETDTSSIDEEINDLFN